MATRSELSNNQEDDTVEDVKSGAMDITSSSSRVILLLKVLKEVNPKKTTSLQEASTVLVLEETEVMLMAPNYVGTNMLELQTQSVVASGSFPHKNDSRLNIDHMDFASLNPPSPSSENTYRPIRS
jgi:hypothetical protein